MYSLFLCQSLNHCVLPCFPLTCTPSSLHDVFLKDEKISKLVPHRCFGVISCLTLPLPSYFDKAHSKAERKRCDAFLDLHDNSFVITSRNNFKIPGKQLKEKSKLDK